MSIILGITDGDNGGAVLLVDGRLAAAINEERLNRMKMSIGFPQLAIKEVLRISSIEPAEVERVALAAYAETFRPESQPNKGWFQEVSSIARIRNEIASMFAIPFGNFSFARNSYRYLKRMTLGRRKSGVRNLLREMGIDAPISYHEHHRCHAIAAYEVSGFEKALSISMDGGGDGCSSHVYTLHRSDEKLINRLDSFDSIGNYYAYVTHMCGFRASIHEGKITGLAAAGEPIYKDIFSSLVDYNEGRIRNRGRLFYKVAINTLGQLLPQDWEHKDLAASIQKHLEDVVVKYVRYWLKRSGIKNVCLSGGVFANVILNQRISELQECDEVFVFPAMGDGGLAAGAAFSAWRKSNGYSTSSRERFAIPHVYLGSSFSEKEIEQALRNSNLHYRRFDDIEKVVARLVYQGKVVARFKGAMEYGPRALGNRSILYKTDDPNVNNWLNKRLNRTEFMPFAPLCLAGHEKKLFYWNPATQPSVPYMTITLNCTEWMKSHCPAVVHLDGTARPQIIDQETNPSLYYLLQCFYEMSGIPVIVNTSFNMHEEPIVCTPEDAIRSYRQGQLDNLAIGNFLLGEEPQFTA